MCDGFFFIALKPPTYFVYNKSMLEFMGIYGKSVGDNIMGIYGKVAFDINPHKSKHGFSINKPCNLNTHKFP